MLTFFFLSFFLVSGSFIQKTKEGTCEALVLLCWLQSDVSHVCGRLHQRGTLCHKSDKRERDKPWQDEGKVRLCPFYFCGWELLVTTARLFGEYQQRESKHSGALF